MHILRLSLGTRLNYQMRLLTLTSLPGTAWSTITASWHSLATYLRHRYPPIEYAAIKEVGPDTGMRHLHVIISCPHYLPRELIARYWHTSTGAGVIDVRLIDTYKPGHFLAKYLAKQLLVGKKQVTYSRGWPKLPPLTTATTLSESFGPPQNTATTLHLPDGGAVSLPWRNCECWAASLSQFTELALIARSITYWADHVPRDQPRDTSPGPPTPS